MKKPTEGEMVLAVADVAGFTKACQGKSEVEVFATLDQFYGVVDKLVSAAGGTVVKFMGDSAFVVFPVGKAKEALAALQDLKSTTSDLWVGFGAACHLRVHAHVGRVASGPLGAEQRFDVVGRAVNDLFRMPWDGPECSEALRKIDLCDKGVRLEH